MTTPMEPSNTVPVTVNSDTVALGVAVGETTQVAAQASDTATEAEQTAESAASIAENAQDSATEAVTVAYDAKTAITELRNEVMGMFAAMTEHTSSDVHDEPVETEPAPERTEPTIDIDDKPDKEDEPSHITSKRARTKYGAAWWFGT